LAAWVYLLKCADGSFYVGCTTNIDQRFGQHQAGEIPGYTSTRLPVEMVWSEEFQTVDDAIVVERQIKGWSRAKKAALARSDWAEVQRLASRAGK
jgi:predicted GIY-YIG superfamily endonuclease